MLRIHLVQLFYNAAYYDSPVDFLEEPCFIGPHNAPLGKVKFIDMVNAFLASSKDRYLTHFKGKVTEIVRWSGERHADLLIFPEYSIPFQLLPDLSELAVLYSMTIVAGTHRVVSGEEAKAVYKQLGIPLQRAPVGSAFAPVLLPDGSVRVAGKLSQSKWEANLVTPYEAPARIDLDSSGRVVRLAVVPCIDCLHPEILGKAWDAKATPLDVLVCPSLSPTTEPFHLVGSLAAWKEAVFAFANTASFGGTSFNLPSDWKPYLKGVEIPWESLPQNVEAVLELDVQPEAFFTKKGSVINAPIAGWPVAFPIVQSQEAPWLTKYLELGKDLVELLEEHSSESGFAMELLDSYLVDHAKELPAFLEERLKNVYRCLLPIYDGNVESLQTMLGLVELKSASESTRSFWGKQVHEAIGLLTNCLKEADVRSLDKLLDPFRSLKNLANELPAASRKPDGKDPRTQPVDLKTSFPEVHTATSLEDLVQRFQDRGGDMETVRDFIANEEIRVIGVSGAVGIGKSDFLNCISKKVFPDWEFIRIPIPADSRFARVVADIGYHLGTAIDIDSLGAASPKVFRQKVRKILAALLTTHRHALVLDDVHEILKNRNADDHKKMKIFVEEAANPPDYVGGQVFLVSSEWLPDSWLRNKGVALLRLKGLRDQYVRRIIEYEMRRAGLAKDGTVPAPPQKLLDIVRGHPLSAKLVVEALHGKDLNNLSDELVLDSVTGKVANALLKRLDITPDDQLLMQKLSVFRLPIFLGVLTRQESDFREAKLLDLAQRCILNYDGRTLEMHEAVRRFYYNQVVASGKQADFERLAVVYYQEVRGEQRPQSENDPAILAELVHHLTLSGELPRAKVFTQLIVEEIKPAARKIYREYKDWERALDMYQIVSEVMPFDLEVLAYIGRCHARRRNWSDSTEAFKRALDVAKRTRKADWWIYRDWGHILSRFNFYGEAKDRLDQAYELNPNDPSIAASVAYIYWQWGETDLACEWFEKALSLNPHHEYTLDYYSKLLRSSGDRSYADILSAKLDAIRSGLYYVEPSEYEMDFDDDL